MAAVLYMRITMPAFGAAAYVHASALMRPLTAVGVFTYLAAKMFDELAA